MADDLVKMVDLIEGHYYYIYYYRPFYYFSRSPVDACFYANPKSGARVIKTKNFDTASTTKNKHEIKTCTTSIRYTSLD
jgi:hypothetical protein